MSRASDLAKNTALISIGKLATQVISFFLLPLYTEYLSTYEYGQYDFVITVVSFIVPIVTLLMEESMFRFLIDCKDEQDKSSIISNTFFFCIINTIVSLMLGVLSLAFFNKEFVCIVITCSIAQIMLALSNALSRSVGNIALFTLSNFFASIIIIFLNIVLIVCLKMGFYGLIVSVIVSNVIASIFVLIKLGLLQYVCFNNINISLLKRMLKYSIPMVPNSLSWAIINLSDRLIIISFLGTSFNGLYSVAYKFTNIINSFYSCFNIAWRESSAKIVRDNDEKEFLKMHEFVRKSLFTVTVCMIFIMQFIYPLLINERYSDGLNYIPILGISVYYLSLSGFYGGVFTAYKDTNILAITSVVAAILNICIDVLLIKHIGIYAAAIASLCAAYFLFYYRKHKMKKYFDASDGVDKYIILCFMVVLAFIYKATIEMKAIVTIMIIFTAMYFNRDIITIVTRKFKNQYRKRSA